MRKDRSLAQSKKPVQRQHIRVVPTTEGLKQIQINKGFRGKRFVRGQWVQPHPAAQPIRQMQKPVIGLKPQQRTLPLMSDAEKEFRKLHPEINYSDMEAFLKSMGMEMGTPMQGYSSPLKRGWLLKYLMLGDMITLKRWQTWGQAITKNELPEQVPKIRIESTPDKEAMQMFKKNLDFARSHGISNPARVLVDWILWGVANELVKEAPSIPDEVNKFWYQHFNLEPILRHPHDYMARLFEEDSYKGSGWFATPMNVTLMITEMTSGKSKPWESVMDPCLGTGSMLLAASNYSFSLHGQDIDHNMVKAATVNGYFYMPWLVRPFPQSMLDKLKKQMEEKNGPKPATQ